MWPSLRESGGMMWYSRERPFCSSGRKKETIPDRGQIGCLVYPQSGMVSSIEHKIGKRRANNPFLHTQHECQFVWEVACFSALVGVVEAREAK